MNPRAARPEDGARLGELAPLLDVDGAIVMLIDRDDGTAAAAAIDPRGTAGTLNTPVFRLLPGSGGDESSALLARLIDELASPRPARLLATCDPLDAAALARFETLGFRPTGAMPYFELGGGMVEYVSGYRDAAGSVVELARPL